MFYHVILTDSCNLCCSYCRGKDFEKLSGGRTPVAIDASLPPDLSYDLRDLSSFLSRDPDPVITFYGGEPLMRMDLVQTMMDDLRGVRFMIQTNGTLLHLLGPDYVNRMETILISVDGPEGVTDANRGDGTFGRVFKNIQGIVRDGFSGELDCPDDGYWTDRYTQCSPVPLFERPVCIRAPSTGRLMLIFLGIPLTGILRHG